MVVVPPVVLSRLGSITAFAFGLVGGLASQVPPPAEIDSENPYSVRQATPLLFRSRGPEASTSNPLFPRCHERRLAALLWLAAHQGEDGSWEGRAVEPRGRTVTAAQGDDDGAPPDPADALTPRVLLALSTHGGSWEDERLREALARGVDWLSRYVERFADRTASRPDLTVLELDALQAVLELGVVCRTPSLRRATEQTLPLIEAQLYEELPIERPNLPIAARCLFTLALAEELGAFTPVQEPTRAWSQIAPAVAELDPRKDPEFGTFAFGVFLANSRHDGLAPIVIGCVEQLQAAADVAPDMPSVVRNKSFCATRFSIASYQRGGGGSLRENALRETHALLRRQRDDGSWDPAARESRIRTTTENCLQLATIVGRYNRILTPRSLGLRTWPPALR